MKTKYVVDTNVLVHWLLKPDGLAARIINSFMLDLFTPEYAIEELTRNENQWSKKRPIKLDLFVDAISTFMEVVPPTEDFVTKMAASALMANKDPKDAPFLMVALMKGADIWSYDQHFDDLPVARVKSEDIRDGSRFELPELWAWLNRSD